MRRKADNRDWHGDASFGAAEGCFFALLITAVVVAIALGVAKALGAW